MFDGFDRDFFYNQTVVILHWNSIEIARFLKKYEMWAF